MNPSRRILTAAIVCIFSPLALAGSNNTDPLGLCESQFDDRDCFEPVMKRVVSATREQVHEKLMELLTQLDSRQAPKNARIISPVWNQHGGQTRQEPYDYAVGPGQAVGITDSLIDWFKSAGIIRETDLFQMKRKLDQGKITQGQYAVLDLGCSKLLFERYHHCADCQKRNAIQYCCNKRCEEGETPKPMCEAYDREMAYRERNGHAGRDGYGLTECPTAVEIVAQSPLGGYTIDKRTTVRHSWRLVQVFNEGYSVKAIREGYELTEELAATHGKLRDLENFRMFLNFFPGGAAADALLRGRLAGEESDIVGGITYGLMDLMPGVGALARNANLARLQKLGKLEWAAYAGIGSVRLAQVTMDLRNNDYNSAFSKTVEGVILGILMRSSFKQIALEKGRKMALLSEFSDPDMAKALKAMPAAEVETVLRTAGIEEAADKAKAIRAAYGNDVAAAFERHRKKFVEFASLAKTNPDAAIDDLVAFARSEGYTVVIDDIPSGASNTIGPAKFREETLNFYEDEARLVAQEENISFEDAVDLVVSEYFADGQAAKILDGIDGFSAGRGSIDIRNYLVSKAGGGTRPLDMNRRIEFVLAQIRAQAVLEETMHMSGIRLNGPGYKIINDGGFGSGKDYLTFANTADEFACYLKDQKDDFLKSFRMKDMHMGDPEKRLGNMMEGDILIFLDEVGFPMISKQMRTNNYAIRKVYDHWIQNVRGKP